LILGKLAEMQHRDISRNKVSPLGLIFLDYFPKIRINSRKAGLPKRTLPPNLGRVQWVQDVHQEIFNVFPNWTSLRRSNSNIVQRKNLEWNLKDHKHIYSKVLSDLQKRIWPMYDSEVKIWLESWIADMQFKIASKTKESITRVVDSSVKNLMKTYVSKIFLIVYAINQVLINKNGKTFDANRIHCKISRNGKISKNYQNASDLALKINYKFLKNYKCKLIKRTFIPVLGTFKLKPLSISTILDCIIQKMFQLVIDPAIDVFADPNSYGFRKCRS